MRVPHDSNAACAKGAALETVILPGQGVTIKVAAADLFRLIGPTKTMFNRGRVVAEVLRNKNGDFEIVLITPPAARSRFERYAKFLVWRVGFDGRLVLKPTIIPEQMAKALLASEEALTFLPEITGLINCPIIVACGDDIQIAGPGYHDETGVLITGGDLPPKLELEEAKELLNELFADFRFTARSDRSRALAALITPAMKLGGHLKGHIPAITVEADKSQTGKGYLLDVITAVYNENAHIVTQRNGGVGSFDESFNSALIAGRPFIQLDNLRGRLDSAHLEAFLTAGKSFSVRVPYQGEVEIDPGRFFVMLTSNSVSVTRDFANRQSIVRILKQAEGYEFRQFTEGDLLQHVRARQSRYLGAVFAIVRAWIGFGRQLTKESRHDFREWVRSLDWIVQYILGEAPLMDDHQRSQERVSNPDLTLLRSLTLAVAHQGQCDHYLNATQLYQIAETAEIDTGLSEPDEEKGARRMGIVMARLFKASDSVSVEGFTITRQEVDTKRDGGGGTYLAKVYVFAERDPKSSAQPHKAHNTPKPRENC